MRYLHVEKNLAHNDIKLENFLIMQDEVCVLADFGFSLF